MKQMRVPWGEERSRFTVIYEGLILDWQRWKEFAALRDSALQTARGPGLQWRRSKTTYPHEFLKSHETFRRAHTR